jgi:hypothetical protein
MNSNQEQMSKQQINSFDEFIQKQKPTEREAFSPKLYFIYNLLHDKLKKSPPFTYETIGTEGYRTLIMYKNTKGIYVVTLYFNEFESYYLLEELD